MSKSGSGSPQHIGVHADDSPNGGEPVLLRVEGLAAGGQGVARRQGLVWFVRGGLPGDLVLAEPTRRRARHVEARIVEIHEGSPARRPAPCRFQSECGGCPWMPLREDVQREWKRRIVAETLRRVGGFPGPEPDPIRVASSDFAYRNRVEFTVARSGPGRPVVGLHAVDPRGEAIVDVDRCLLQGDEANDVLTTIRGFLGESTRGRPFESRVTIRRSTRSGEMLVAVRDSRGRFPGARRLAQRIMTRHPAVAGVVRLHAPAGRRGGTRTSVLAGRDRIVELLGEARVSLPAASFSQVSADGAEALIDLVTELAGDVSGSSVLDLYGGIGLFGAALIRRGADTATVCDADRQAVDAASEIAAGIPQGRLRSVHDDVGAFLGRLELASPVRLIVANPPRTGLGRGVAARMVEVRAERIVLVSCDPATLARDLKALRTGGAYELRRVVPVDLFPQTAHVEAVALLTRFDSGYGTTRDGGEQ